MIQLGYLTLDTPDLDRARRFYGALFDWRFDAAASHETYAHVADSDPALGLRKGERTDFSHLYFRVPDVDALCDRVVELGGEAAVPSDSPSGRSVTCRDDQGVSFSLWAPAEGY
jgi:predicted enzyme related to lactoylglutathione lyase